MEQVDAFEACLGSKRRDDTTVGGQYGLEKATRKVGGLNGVLTARIGQSTVLPLKTPIVGQRNCLRARRFPSAMMICVQRERRGSVLPKECGAAGRLHHPDPHHDPRAI